MVSVKTDDSAHVAILLGKTFNLIRDGFRGEDWGGLRQSHFRLMSVLPEDGTSITELAERLGMTKQGCGQFVTALADSGHVEVKTDPADRRVRVVRRTARGDATLRSVNERIQRLEREWADQVGARRYATFRRVMEELTAEQRAAGR